MILVLLLFIVNGIQARLITSPHPDCFPVKEDPNTLLCRAVPVTCTSLLANKYSRIVFDLENKYDLHARQIFNCSFVNGKRVELVFKNIRNVNERAFDSILIGENVSLSVKFDGAGLKLSKSAAGAVSSSRLVFQKNAMKSILFGKWSRLDLEIINYELVDMRDLLADTNGASLWPNVNSEIRVSIRKVSQLVVRSSRTSQREDQYDDDYENLDDQDTYDDEKTVIDQMDKEKYVFKNNLTYGVFVAEVNEAQFDDEFFAKLHINPYSSWLLQINTARSLRLGRSLFDGLLLGYSANFNLLVENVHSVGLDKFIFSGLQQEKYSVFYLYLEKIGFVDSETPSLSVTTRLMSRGRENNKTDDGDYEDYENVSDVDEYLTSNVWFCVPEGLFDNVLMSDSTLTQIHFMEMDTHVSVSNNSFRDITLGAESKFQLMFQDIAGHVVFDESSINMIRLGDGQLEIWLDDSIKKQTSQDNTNRSATFSAAKLVQYETNGMFKLLDPDIKNRYIMFMPRSLSKIYTTPKSSFRLAFQTFSSVSVLNFLSIYEFHFDRFKSSSSNERNEDRDFRTKLELDLTRDLTHAAWLDFLNGHSDSSEYLDDSSSSLPKVIELDGYRPIMSVIRDDSPLVIVPDENHEEVNTEDLSTSSQKQRHKAKKTSPGSFGSTDDRLIDEFCRFYKLRPFMTSFVPNSDSHKSNLIFFKETTESDYMGANLKENNVTCTSCLLIYLYRHVHRRSDFYFVKSQLPACFVRLHYNIDRIYLLNSINQNERDEYVRTVEESFRYYWKLLNCYKLTGIERILDVNEHQSDDESISFYDSARGKCSRESSLAVQMAESERVTKMDPTSVWHKRYSQRICAKNQFDTRITSRFDAEFSSSTDIGLKKSKNPGQLSNSNKTPKLPIAVLVLFLVCISSMGLIIMRYKFKKSGRYCVHFKLSRAGSSQRSEPGFQRLKNSNVTKYNGQNVTLAVTQADVIDENELDDDEEFEERADRVRSGSGGNYGVLSADLSNCGEQSYDAYEYDDEFEINQNSTTINNEDMIGGMKVANYSTLNDDYDDEMLAMGGVDLKRGDESSTVVRHLSSSDISLSSLTQRSLRQFKKLKSNLMSNKDIIFRRHGLLTKLGGKYSGYRSTTDANDLVAQMDAQNEFMEMRGDTTSARRVLDDQEYDRDDQEYYEDHDHGANVLVATYDVKKKSKQSGVVRKQGELEPPTSDVMRVATNPMDLINDLETVHASVKKSSSFNDKE